MFVYLAGGMTGLSFEESNEWRVYIKDKLGTHYDNFGVECVNPQDYYNLFDDTAYDSEREVMEFDLHKLRGSDLVIVNFNSVYSLGTMAEIAIAYELKIPIIGLNENNNELHPWQKEMCNKIFTDIDELIEYVDFYYL